MPQHPRGVFLTVEGIEGVGKSTIVKCIEKYLHHAKKMVVMTREPGGTEIAEHIRQLLLTPNLNETMLPETELLLMFASRVQHIRGVIEPALQKGEWVVSDRFVDASFAYQGGGRQINLSYIEMLEKWLVKNPHPDLTILLDAPVEIGLQRAKHRGPHDRIEQEKTDFFERVRQVYLTRAKNDSRRFRVIDATQPLSVVEMQVEKILDEIFTLAQ